MPQIVDTFTVQAEGIGRRDFTNTVERSTSYSPTRSLRQSLLSICSHYLLPVGPWPFYYIIIWPMPQEDGSFGYEASTIIENYYNVQVSIRKNALVGAALIRFASYADAIIYNIAQYFPRVFGYGKVKIDFTHGISTRPGSVYGLLFGFWTGGVTEHVDITINGLVSELTPPWM